MPLGRHPARAVAGTAPAHALQLLTPVWQEAPGRCGMLRGAAERGAPVAEEARVPGWAGFEAAAPALATAGRRLLVGADGVAIGFLATVADAGPPHLAPVCPIFAGGGLYLSASRRTPKVADLRTGRGYALHAFLGESDEEFRIAGGAGEVLDPGERSLVHEAIPFAAFDRDDPLFRLSVESALWVHWERVGRPDTRAVRRRWPQR